uniref:Nicotinamide mononucleotide transporter n=1 Tax=viral metagenome TaxID=1070528 RepID=A0A6C0ERX4_9ZZZZ
MEGLHSILLKTVYLSLFVQIITGIADVYVLFAVTGEKLILKALLLLELIVQVIEGSFYVWMVSLFSTIKDVTPKRYFDWALSTPLMLFTLCIYLDYLKKEKEENERKKEKYENNEKKETNENLITILFEKFNEHKTTLIPVFILNWLMLLLGYLGETGVIYNLFAVILGFIPFIAYYAIIYFKFARYTKIGQLLFWFFAIIWAFYGKAALMSYYWKNITYNILDVFSKNFFGLYLAYLVWNK